VPVSSHLWNFVGRLHWSPPLFVFVCFDPLIPPTLEQFLKGDLMMTTHPHGRSFVYFHIGRVRLFDYDPATPRTVSFQIFTSTDCPLLLLKLYAAVGLILELKVSTSSPYGVWSLAFPHSSPQGPTMERFSWTFKGCLVPIYVSLRPFFF